MLERLFPTHLNNDYRGNPAAKWAFGFITMLTLGRSLVHIFALDGGAKSIATIPLDTFTQNGAATVVLMFSLWGLSQLLIGILYGVVLWRYQAFIPFMYLLLMVEYSMRIFLGWYKPIEITGTAPGGVGNYILVPFALLMFILSLGNRKKEA